MTELIPVTMVRTRLTCGLNEQILMRWEIRSKPDDFIRRNNFEMHYDSALLTFTPLQEQLHTDLSLLKVL
jgi:hypothetical protein